MGIKEKLVEIIQNSVGGCARHWAEVIADGLIAHGVTVQEWIPASEPPKEKGRYWCNAQRFSLYGLVIVRKGE